MHLGSVQGGLRGAESVSRKAKVLQSRRRVLLPSSGNLRSSSESLTPRGNCLHSHCHAYHPPSASHGGHAMNQCQFTLRLALLLGPLGVAALALGGAATGLPLDGPPHVLYISPSPNAIDVPTSTSIRVTFDSQMDGATINSSTFVVYCDITGPHAGAVTYDPGTRMATFYPASSFDIGTLVSVVLTTGIQSIGGQALEYGHAYGFTIGVAGGTGGFAPTESHQTGSTCTNLTVADLDGDGDPDIASANWYSDDLTLLSNNGDGTFTVADTVPVGNTAACVAAADLDGDGDVDLVSADHSSATVTVLLYSGAFQYESNAYGVGANPMWVSTGDFDGDGYVDLATANSGSNNVSILLNQQDGTFAAQVVYPAGNGPFSLVVADFDGDADLDVVSTNRNTNNISLLRNNGHGVFGSATNYPGGHLLQGSAVGDLDADGDCDIVTSSPDDAYVSVLLNHGDGSFAPGEVHEVAGQPGALVAVDVDDDSDLDLIVTGGATAAIEVFINDGQAEFGAPMEYAVGYYPSGIAAADLSGDGDLDVAVAGNYLSHVTVVENVGTPFGADFAGYPVSGEPPLLVQFTDLSSGNATAWAWDFQNDGIVDNTTRNPAWEYAAPGSYSVSLTIYAGGDSASVVKPEYIQVVAPPLTANFVGQPTVGPAPLQVEFTDLSEGEEIIAWEWDFQNDGVVDATTPDPVCEYAAPGLYSVALTVFSETNQASLLKQGYIRVLGDTFVAIRPGMVTHAQPDPIVVEYQGSTSLGAVSLFVEFDSGVVSFAGIESYVPGEVFSGGVVGGRISIQWFDETGGSDPIVPGVDPDSLFGILLTSNECAGTTQLAFDEVQCMLGDGVGNPVPGVQWVDEPPYGTVIVDLSGNSLIIPAKEITSRFPTALPIFFDGIDSLGALSLFLEFDSSKLSLEGIESYVLGETFQAGIVGNRLSIQWFDETGGQDPIVPGVDPDSLFGILFSPRIPVGTTQVSFDEAQSMIADPAGDPLPCVRWLDEPPNGVVTINVAALIGGRVGYYAGDRPVPRATLTMDPPYSDTETDASGLYSLEHPAGDCVLHIGKSTDPGGINALDAIKVIRHSIGAEFFDDPYELIAANVNGDGFINALDAIKIVRAAVGFEALPSGDWLFDPDQVAFQPLAGDTTQNFVAVRMGDVNGSWQPDSRIGDPGLLAACASTLASGAGRETITVAFPDTTIDAEATPARFPILVTEFNEIGAISLRITFADSVLYYSQVISHVPGVTFVSNLVGNEIRIEWYDGTGGAHPISIGSDTLLTVEFDLVGDPGETSVLNFTSACTLGDADGDPITDVQFIDGSCTLAGPVALDERPPTLSLQLRAFGPVVANQGVRLLYELPGREHVVLRVFNVAGQLVEALVDEERPPGQYVVTWGARSTQGPAPAGLYFIRLDAGASTRRTKLVLIR